MKILPEGKHLVAVEKGSGVTVGMIYDGQRFSAPPTKASPVVVVKEAPQATNLMPFSIPPPLPPAQSQPSSVVVNVNKDGARDVVHHPGSAATLSQMGTNNGGEPAASAIDASPPIPQNVASTSSRSEYPTTSKEYSDNNLQFAEVSQEIQKPVISVNASVDEMRVNASEYIEKQARAILESIPKNRENVREAISHTVIRSQAALSKCTTKQHIEAAILAARNAMAEYIDRSNSGALGNG